MGAAGAGPAFGATTFAAGLVLGAVALAVLWALELGMVVVLLGVPLAEAPAAVLTPGGRIGLAAQLAMARVPALRRRAGRHRRVGRR